MVAISHGVPRPRNTLTALEPVTLPEEKKRKGYQITGRVGGAIADIMVPLPVLNDVALGLLNDVMGMFQDGEKEGDVFKFFAKDQKTFLEQLGVLGIIGGKAMKAYEMVQLARTGVAENEYIGKKSIYG